MLEPIASPRPSVVALAASLVFLSACQREPTAASAPVAEPAQTRAFDEVTVVVRGTVRVHGVGGVVDVAAGESVRTRAGERVRYEVPADAGETEYVAVCTPAFDPATVRREDA